MGILLGFNAGALVGLGQEEGRRPAEAPRTKKHVDRIIAGKSLGSSVIPILLGSALADRAVELLGFASTSPG